MKVVAIVGGLGSQMFKYAYYLSLKTRTSEPCLIDTSFFLERECWNGYELKKLFNVNEPDLIDLYKPDDLKELKEHQKLYYEKAMSFLSNESDYHYYFLGKKITIKKNKEKKIKRLRFLRKVRYLEMSLGIKHSYSVDDFTKTSNDYFDEYFHNSDEHFSGCKNIIIDAFKFPDFDDKQNKDTAAKMSFTESVAIHIRRSDHLSDNGKLFTNGFYKKAVSFIKENKTSKQSFYLFSDDLKWCKDNLDSLGLSPEDDVIFVDWNKGDASYKDMQLMTHCQHNVIPISSFSWWGYYLSKRSNKIVIAPKNYWLDVPIHF